MTRTLTVVIDGEVFRPTEPFDLPANTTYQVRIDTVDPVGSGRSVDPDARPLESLLEFSMDIGLGDLAEQHDHYFYGTPKR